MSSPYRLKIKIGPHEFEAEGESEVVQQQFQAFKEIIAATPTVPVTQPQTEVQRSENETNPPASRQTTPSPDNQLDKIMRADNRIVSLTARAQTVDDAVLLILYGQKILRGNDGVGGFEVVSGVTATGGYDLGRSDRVLDKLSRDGDVIVIGERRSRRYRLTNTGIAKARQIAADLLATVA